MYSIKPARRIRAEITVPADKSISHRALMISAIATGTTLIRPFVQSDDVLATLECLKKLGVATQQAAGGIHVHGAGKYFPAGKHTTLFAGESGTTMRILSGILCGQKFSTFFEAATALEGRPMARIVEPLRRIGADISGRLENKEIYPPLTIRPAGRLRGREHTLAVASAQVKSALLLAALYAEGRTAVTEPQVSRDHTERMLAAFKVPVKKPALSIAPPFFTNGRRTIIGHTAALISPGELFVPGDFSSAAFFIVLALISPDSRIEIKDVNINPTRTGLLRVLERMGAKISLMNKKNEYEPRADIIVESSELAATTVEAHEVPCMIDEVPIACVAAAFAAGRTEIKGLGELRVKETDRIDSMVHNLRTAGVDIRDESHGGAVSIVIEGRKGPYTPGNFVSHFDHRTAMSMIVFASALDSESTLDDTECIDKSFPEFVSLYTTMLQRP